MNNKIAIIIPTIHRDDVLMETLNSILDNGSGVDWIVYIIDQNKEEDYSKEKRIFYEIEQRIKVIKAPYDCGLSMARNLGVEQASKDEIPYCLISADSIKFSDSMKHINNIVKYLNYSPDFNIDLLGLNLKNRNVGWEAWLDLKDSFVLDFIDKYELPGGDFCYFDKIKTTIFHCDIVRNFFLATTQSLLNTKWDNNLKMREHEDFFWRYKQEGFKVGWTNLCHGEYIGKKEGAYLNLRTKNMRECKDYLFKKYNLKSWVKYINLDRAKNQCD